MDANELRWRRFEMDVSLYRSYLEFVIKFNVFYYAITGALISFYFTHRQNELSVYALWFPLLMSAGFSAFFLYGSTLVKVMRDSIVEDARHFHFSTYPEIRVLQVLLIIFGMLFLVIAIGLGYLVWKS